MLLCGCVGGGSSQTPPSSAIDIKTEQLYTDLAVRPAIISGACINFSPALMDIPDFNKTRDFDDISEMERATGFEPATSSLGSLRSTN